MSDVTEKDRSALSVYLAEIREIARLTPEEEEALRRDLIAGEPRVTMRLVRSHLGFAVKIALEYRGMGLLLEDLLAEANLGLIEAAQRFDVHRGTKFTTYAVWWIRKSILSALAEKNDLIRSPAGKLKQYKQFREAEEELHRKLGRKPEREEISRHLSTDIRDLDALLRLRARVVSIDQPVGEDGAETLGRRLLDSRAASPEQHMLEREWIESLTEALSALPERERIIIVRRFGLDGESGETLNEIASRIGLSRERVRQIEEQARHRLRRAMMKKTRRSLDRRPASRRNGTR